uniref:Peptidase M3A/M3B catalytic domain-containing protein n=1 Tax=Helicotheca tamesis TaxID=374047 RepID=A0A7S2MC90_9STRA
MALASTDTTTYSSENLFETKKDMEDLLSNPDVLEEAKLHRSNLDAALGEDGGSSGGGDDEKLGGLVKTLDIIIRTCQCNDMSSSPEAKSIREETSKIESELGMSRNSMKLGYIAPDDDDDDEKNDETDKKGVFIPASSVALRNMVRTSAKESRRKAAYEGLRSIGPFVCSNGFVEIVKLRNKLARKLGFVDYYDYTVTNAEGFGKDKLFEILDDLELSTRPLMEEGRKELAKRYGDTALEPWNLSFMMAGSVIKKMDPYFPFSKSVERYVKSYSALNITYADATMTLDLLDRQKKYSNGFCHWPVCAWVKPDGTLVPSKTNFTSLANPTAVGSGLTALTTLMHEAGHAAHFANIRQPSPLFSQERAPTSVAYAENQSMFLDSLVGDAAWRAKYALDLDGTPIPFEIIEEEIRATQPFAVFALRGMLAVSYFEKALYELPEEEVTTERIQTLADEIENKIQGGLSPRPVLSVPHIVSDEASCYYQGYTLAEMSVHQTRAYFKKKYGYIVDNPNVGPTLTKAYWECGNSRLFLDLVRDLTGKDLSGEDWTDALKESMEERITREKEEYDEAIRQNATTAQQDEQKEREDIDLKMAVKFVDGDLLIADSTKSKGGLLGACKEFEEFVASRIASTETAAE